MPEPQQGALADGVRSPRILADQRPQHLPVPALGMAHIENRMQGEIVPVAGFDSEPFQTG